MTQTTLPGARRFALIAFDWDGTLYDSTAVIVRCIQGAVRDVGGVVPTDEQAAYVIGMGLMQALAHAAPNLAPDKYPLLGQRYRHHYAQQVGKISLFAGVLPLLHRLKARGHLLAVATGKSRLGLDQALAMEELAGVFDASRTADQTEGKPHPRMLHELMSELGVAPENVLMVGDTTHDLQMAINAGCASLGVAYGAHPGASLQALQPLFVAQSVAGMQQWLLDHA